MLISYYLGMVSTIVRVMNSQNTLVIEKHPAIYFVVEYIILDQECIS